MRNFLAFILVFAGILGKAQFSVHGKVISSHDKKGISDCSVSLLAIWDDKLIEKVYTGDQGEFSLTKVKGGSYKLVIFSSGYKLYSNALQLDENKTGMVIELVPLQVVSDEVVIESIRSKKSMEPTYTIIKAAEINKKNYAQDLPVILNTTPSAVFTTDAGAGVGYTGLRIRGIDASRINVTINGVPLNDAESHGVYWVDLPDLASNLENIQVQRGVGTSTNGSAAFGSSINIQTTKSSTEPYAMYTSSYGSFNTFKNNIKFGTGLLKNHWTMEGSLSKISSDGYIDRASSVLRSGYGSVARYGKKSLLKFNILSGAEKTYQAWYGVPQDTLLGISNDSMHIAPHRTYNAYTYPNQTDNYWQTHYQLLYSYVLSSKLMLNTTLHYTKGKGYYESYYYGAALGDFGMPDYKINDSTSVKTSDIINQQWLNNDFYGAVISAVYKEKKYEINAGASFNRYIGQHYNEVTWSELWTAPKPGGTYSPFRYYSDTGIKNDGAAYGKLFYTINKKLNVFGDVQLRYLTYNYNAPDTLSVLHNLTQKYFFVNPKAGIEYQMHDSSSFLFYYGRSAHEPTRDEFVQSTSASLPKAEYLNDFEIAYKKYYKGWDFKINFYDMLYKDQLILTGKINDVGSPVRQNVPKSYRSGVEFMVQKDFTRNFSWTANASFSQSRILDFDEYITDYALDSQLVFHYKTTPIAFSPAIVAASILKYKLRDFEFEWVSKYVGKQFLDNSGSDERKLDPYFVNDLHIRYTVTRQKLFDELSISGVLYNIYGVLYQSNGYTYGDISGGIRNSYNYYYPQARQNFMVMVQLRF